MPGGASKFPHSILIDIYTLSDPRTGEVRYIGKSKDATNRFKAHIRESQRRAFPVSNWIRKLLKENLSPILNVIKKVREEDWELAEKQAITEYQKKSVLLNLADGGVTIPTSPETRSANAKKLGNWVKNLTPRQKELWQLKVRLGRQLRSEYATEKMRSHYRELAKKEPLIWGFLADL